MIKHFENLYEEAEQLSEKEREAISHDELITRLISNIKLFDDILYISTAERQGEVFGQIMFNICSLSKRYNVNAYEALQNAMNKVRAEIMDHE